MDFVTRVDRFTKSGVIFLVILLLYFLNVFLYPSVYLEHTYQSTTIQPQVSTLPSSGIDLTSLNASWRMSNLVDRHDFRFLLNNRKCESSPTVFMIVFVHSAPSHHNRRHTIRQTWGQENNALVADTVRLVFLMGQPSTAALQGAIEAENASHGDIVQGNFLDTYRNLTYKHVMGLKWVSHFCRHAQYVFKTDDDIFVDIIQLVDYLKNLFAKAPPPNLMMCIQFRTPYVKRSHRSKWYVPVKEYPDNYYPSYCSGWVVIMSTDAVFNLYLESSTIPYFWVDDVVVSGILAQRLGIRHVRMNDLIPSSLSAFTRWFSSRQMGRQTEALFALSEINEATIYKLWNKTMQYYQSLKK